MYKILKIQILKIGKMSKTYPPGDTRFPTDKTQQRTTKPRDNTHRKPQGALLGDGNKDGETGNAREISESCF